MQFSENRGLIAAALAKASAEIVPVAKDRSNPFYKSKYTTLDAITDAVRPVLAKHGVSILQGATKPETNEVGQILSVIIETYLLHESGEWVSASVVMPVGTTPIEKGSDVRAVTAQTVGSAISYGRRYCLSALLAITSDEDDDGNAASGKGAQTQAQEAPRPSGRDRLWPAWSGFVWSGKKFREIPTSVLAEQMKRAETRGTKAAAAIPPDERAARLAQNLVEAIVFELEARREANDAPPEPEAKAEAPVEAKKPEPVAVGAPEERHPALDDSEDDGLPF